MAFPNGVVPTEVPVHPVPLYEMTACFALALYLYRIPPTSRPLGTQLGIYLIVSAAVRFLLEFIRRNPAWLLGLTTAQWMSAGSIAIGWYLLRNASQPWPDPDHFQTRPPAPDGEPEARDPLF